MIPELKILIRTLAVFNFFAGIYIIGLMVSCIHQSYEFGFGEYSVWMFFFIYAGLASIAMGVINFIVPKLAAVTPLLFIPLIFFLNVSKVDFKPHYNFFQHRNKIPQKHLFRYLFGYLYWLWNANEYTLGS